ESVRLLAFFLEPASGALAERLDFALDLRSGSVVRGGRELPAMRLTVARAEAARRSRALEAQGSASAEERSRLVQRGRVDELAALSLAVRLDAAERERALESLRALEPGIPEPDLAALAPALRWITGLAQPGGDTLAWRAVLRNAGRPEPARPRERLVLPPARPRGEPLDPPAVRGPPARGPAGRGPAGARRSDSGRRAPPPGPAVT